MPQRPRNSPPPTPDTAMRLMWVMWVAFLITQGLFFLLTLMRTAVIERETNPLVTLVMLAAAVMLVVASYLVRAQIAARATAKQNLQGIISAGVVAVAICEGAGILGVANHFAINSLYNPLFFVISAVGILGHFPRRGQIDAATAPKPMPTA